MPQNPEKMEGIAMTIVIEARNFVTIFRLLETREANASIVPERISI